MYVRTSLCAVTGSTVTNGYCCPKRVSSHTRHEQVHVSRTERYDVRHMCTFDCLSLTSVRKIRTESIKMTLLVVFGRRTNAARGVHIEAWDVTIARTNVSETAKRSYSTSVHVAILDDQRRVASCSTSFMTSARVTNTAASVCKPRDKVCPAPGSNVTCMDTNYRLLPSTVITVHFHHTGRCPRSLFAFGLLPLRSGHIWTFCSRVCE